MPKATSRKPPYGSFKTTRAFIERLKRTALPDAIDRTVMGAMSGDSQSETLSAFRFLGLLGENDTATDALRELVSAFATPQWPSALAKVITNAYAPIIGNLNIKTATAGALASGFKSKGVDGYMLARSIRFYVAALKEADIKASPHFKAPTVRKSNGNPGRSRKPKKSSEALGKGGRAHKTPETPSEYTEFPLRDGRKIIIPSNLNESDVSTITQYLTAFVGKDA